MAEKEGPRAEGRGHRGGTGYIPRPAALGPGALALDIARVSICPYRLPLRQPWISARGRLDAREGWLVAVTADGIWGYGDCAPLPEAGTEPPALAAQALGEHRACLPGLALAEALERLDRDAARTPAAAWALECALLDLASRRRALPLRTLLAPEASSRVPVNAALGALADLDDTDAMRAAVAGFRVLKLKVGLADPAWELARLARLAERLPAGIGLRLDANGAWDKPAATRFLDGLGDLPVECLEEPLREADPAALAELQSRVRFALALDESLSRGADALDPARFPVRRAVLKPAALGGLRRTLELARTLQGAGIEIVVTSLVDSAAGLWPTAQLAAAIGSPVAQGLATAHWLARDLGAAPQPENGRLSLPDRPGSGFAPAAPSALNR